MLQYIVFWTTKLVMTMLFSLLISCGSLVLLYASSTPVYHVDSLCVAILLCYFRQHQKLTILSFCCHSFSIYHTFNGAHVCLKW